MDKDKRIKELESALFLIANIDTTFINGEGDLDDYTPEQALAKINDIAYPFWENYCDCEQSKNKEELK